MKTNRCRIAVLLVASLSVAAIRAQTNLPDSVEFVTSAEGITEYRLDNGLRVLLFPDPSKATITVNVTYLVGSVHESYGETGMAHLLEHMLFKGTPTHSDIISELQDRGAQFNGTTSWERTNYYETFDASPENLAWALELEADRMVNSFVSREDLDSEMTVVRNEFESSESNSAGVLLYRVLNAAYVWHGYGNPPIGSRSDIENVPIERLQSFYRNFYQPDNAVIVVAGRIEEGETLGLIAESFGTIPRPGRTLVANYTVEPTQEGEREVVLRRVGDLQFLMAGFHTADGTHEDFVPLQIATHALTNAPSGRLYQALVQPGLAAQVAEQTLQMKDPGMIIIVAILRAEQSMDAVRETVLATIDDLKVNPITEEEVERAGNQLLSGFEQQMNDSQAVALQLSNWAAIGDWRMMFLDRDRVRDATVEDVQAAALHYFKPTNRTMGMFFPDAEPDRTVIPERPELASLLAGYTGDEARSVGEAFDPAPANIEARTARIILPSGIKLAMLPKETRGDTVQVAMRFNFGDEESLKGMSRIGPMTAQMLMRGTTSRSRQEIQDELAGMQSRLNVGGGYDNAVASIQSTREHLEAVLQLAIEVLREPAFPEEEFATLRDLAIASIESQRNEPQAIVGRAFTRHFTAPFGREDVRYSPTVEEELDMLNDISVEDLRAFHDAFYGASNAEIVLVGDFDAASVRQLIAERLDAWQSPSGYTEIFTPYPEPPVEAINQNFETPDKENAFFMGGVAVRMSSEDDDYPAMVMGNYLLGQGASSRLFSRIRGREGLSYGVGSQFQAQAKVDGARFLVNAISAPQNAERVEASFRDELASVLSEGYGAEELETAKNSWAQSRQVARAQDQALTGMLLARLHNERTMEWDAELEAAVLALTPAEIRNVMRQHLDPDRMTFMKGGDFAGVTED